MKKHKVIEHAYENYPKGTKFTWSKDTHPKVVESSGKFIFIDDIDGKLILADAIEKDLAIWNGEKWAEIVKPKIAVKVENEKEFKALMKYFKENKLFHAASMPEPYAIDDFAYGNCFTFHDKWFSIKDTDTDYQIIPFDEFAEDKGIKLPEFYFVSEDGVSIFEGDSVWVPQNHCARGFYPEPNKMLALKNWATLTNSKFFHDKQKALSWIEAHKPKEIIYNVPESKFTIKIQKNRVYGFDGLAYLDLKDMQYIINTMQELQK